MRVFLSYAREDVTLAGDIAAALREQQVDVLWDRTLSPPLDYSEQIRGMVRAADSFAVLLTPHSVSSAECAAEMSYAVELGKRLVPILGAPEIRPDGLPNAIRKAQWCLCTERHSLAGAVAQIQAALQTNIELVPMHTRLLNRVEEWQSRGRDAGTLLRDPFLKEAEDWLLRATSKEQLPQPTSLQREYLSVSRAAEIRNVITFRRRAVGGIVVLIVAVLVMVFLYLQSERNRKEADRQREKAEQNAAEAERQTGIAKQNAAEAMRQTTIANDERDLANRRNRTLLEERGRQELIEGRWDAAAVLLGEAFRIGSDAPALRLMLARALLPLKGSRATLVGGDSPMTGAAFSANGRRVILGTLNGNASVWDVGTGQLISVLSGHEGPIFEVHLDGNGSRALVVFTRTLLDVAESGYYRVSAMPAYVWDVDRSTMIREQDLGDYERLRGASPPLVAIRAGGHHFAFPDGSEFRFSDGEEVAPGPPTPSVKRAPEDSRSGALASSADGGWVVVPGPGNSAIVTASGWRENPLLASVSVPGAQATFQGTSPDLVVVNRAGALRRVLAKDNTVTASATLPTGTDIVLGPDGRSAVVLRDGTGIPFDLDAGAAKEEWEGTLGVTFSPGGTFVLGWSKVQGLRFEFWAQRTRGSDRRPQMGSVRPGRSAVAVANYDQGIAAVSDDGSVFFADRKAAQVWWAGRPGGRPRPADAAEGTPSDPVLAQFSPDGRVLALALADGSILTRDGSGPQVREGRLHADASVANHLEFSSDSRRLASAGDDGTVKIWDLASGALAATCRGHRSGVRVARLSRDGHLLATAGDDGTARVWELPSCRELLRFPGHDGGVLAVVFDAGATRLATTDRRSVRVWDLAREARDRATVAHVVTAFSPACLLDGVLGRWTMPAAGSSRGPCMAR